MINSKWMRVIPLTAKELAEERIKSIAFQEKYFGSSPGKFTCDDCKIASSCRLVFDDYNTNGDCLLEK